MSMWPLLVVYGALVGADVLRALQRSNPGGLRGFLRDTSGAIRGRLHAAYGTELSLESLLADVALANAASRELLGPGGVDGRVGGGVRTTASLSAGAGGPGRSSGPCE